MVNNLENEQYEIQPEDITAGPVHLRVGTNLKERRLDKYLHGRFCNFSRVMIQEIIKAGGVKVNDNPGKCSMKLNPDDRIDLVLPELPKNEILPEDIPLNVIYEDNDILIINKQSDLIVHPARAYKTGTLVNALVHYCDTLSTGLGEARPGIVHRLDRNTTGVMVVTKNDEAQWKVATQFERRETKKSYMAIVHGCPELDSDRIKAPIGMHPTHREKCAVRPETGKEAISIYHVVERFKGFSLVEVRILTGRTHQIRVHLSHIKHPVVGDDMYGGKLVYPWQLKNEEPKVEEPVMDRLALHAFSLEFKHPTTNEWQRFEAPLAPDMQHLLEMLREYRSL